MDPAPRVAAATASMGFTPRQAQVLGLLALGRSNKAIASELGCAESTVEIHVTAVLGKSRCGSRCELVSRFWSEPMNRAPVGSPRDFRQYRRGVGSAQPGASCAGLAYPGTPRTSFTRWIAPSSARAMARASTGSPSISARAIPRHTRSGFDTEIS